MTSFVFHICTDTCPLPLFFPCLDDDTLCPALRRKVLGRTAGGTTASVPASVERCSENDLDMIPSSEHSCGKSLCLMGKIHYIILQRQTPHLRTRLSIINGPCSIAILIPNAVPRQLVRKPNFVFCLRVWGGGDVSVPVNLLTSCMLRGLRGLGGGRC